MLDREIPRTSAWWRMEISLIVLSMYSRNNFRNTNWTFPKIPHVKNPVLPHRAENVQTPDPVLPHRALKTKANFKSPYGKRNLFLPVLAHGVSRVSFMNRAQRKNSLEKGFGYNIPQPRPIRKEDPADSICYGVLLEVGDLEEPPRLLIDLPGQDIELGLSFPSPRSPTKRPPAPGPSCSVSLCS
jgi:hypothetical protein